MRLPKRGEKGFTLIELLIVVAILGVLAAVVIPNVGRFIGRGEDEAAATEFANIQTSVIALMTDNQLDSLPNPVDTTATANMSLFPDPTSECTVAKLTDPEGVSYQALDGDGYILFGHDVFADNSVNATVNYVATEITKGTYTVDSLGTVVQVKTGYE